MTPNSREAYRFESTDKIQSSEVLGSRDTTRLTAMKHLGLGFLEGERTCDEHGESFNSSRGGKQLPGGWKDSSIRNDTV